MDFSILAQHLAEHHLTLTSAESLTSGTFQSQLAATPQASQVYPGGFITYATEAKTKLLGIPKTEIAKYGVVSPEIAEQMAQHARRLADTDFALAFTGAAGPDKLDGAEVGTVCIGLVGPKVQLAKTYHFSGDPKQIMAQTCQAGLNLLEQHLTQ
ncbi:CinA family protein [Pediococcus siamensis]|uniref:CinA family protein n=1 Tax=Pediococcus siamensis TaxID=381829 RepID=UPI0039A374F2